jgi:hypothetical protein
VGALLALLPAHYSTDASGGPGWRQFSSPRSGTTISTAYPGLYALLPVLAPRPSSPAGNRVLGAGPLDRGGPALVRLVSLALAGPDHRTGRAGIAGTTCRSCAGAHVRWGWPWLSLRLVEDPGPVQPGALRSRPGTGWRSAPRSAPVSRSPRSGRTPSGPPFRRARRPVTAPLPRPAGLLAAAIRAGAGPDRAARPTCGRRSTARPSRLPAGVRRRLPREARDVRPASPCAYGDLGSDQDHGAVRRLATRRSGFRRWYGSRWTGTGGCVSSPRSGARPRTPRSGPTAAACVHRMRRLAPRAFARSARCGRRWSWCRRRTSTAHRRARDLAGGWARTFAALSPAPGRGAIRHPDHERSGAGVPVPASGVGMQPRRGSDDASAAAAHPGGFSRQVTVIDPVAVAGARRSAPTVLGNLLVYRTPRTSRRRWPRRSHRCSPRAGSGVAAARRPDSGCPDSRSAIATPGLRRPGQRKRARLGNPSTLDAWLPPITERGQAVHRAR